MIKKIILSMVANFRKPKKQPKKQPTGPTVRLMQQSIVCCTPMPRLDESGQRRQRNKLGFSVDPTATILLLGDSLLANWSTNANEIHNMAVGGDCVQNTMWMVMNTSDEVCRHKFSKIFILVGTNNITRRMDARPIISGLQLLIQMVNDRWPDSTVVVMTIPHRNDPRARDPVRQRVNAWISSGRVDFFDTDKCLSVNDSVLDEGGLHLLPSAYAHIHRDMIASLDQPAVVTLVA